MMSAFGVMQTSDSKDVASVFVKVFGCRAHDPERSLFGPKSHGARTYELMLSKPTRRQQRSKRYLEQPFCDHPKPRSNSVPASGLGFSLESLVP